MTTLLYEPSSTPTTNPAARLRTEMLAMRLSFNWFGTRKSLSPAQKAIAAESFGAEGDYLSAGKKLINTKDERFKAVSSVRSRAVACFKGQSLPFPEPGVRLLRHDDLGSVTVQLTTLKQELDEAVTRLNEHYEELKSAARRRLGDLYCEGDYPETLAGLFDVTWDFPSVEPPPYLQQLSPELYRQECRRVQARFDEAVGLAEAAFLDELAKLVDHLAERLSGQQDGRPKVFRDSAVTNLTEFFERFRSLNVNSNAELDELVERANRLMQGVEPQDLRDSGDLREHVTSQLAGLQSSLDGLLVDRPRRNIQRRPR